MNPPGECNVTMTFQVAAAELNLIWLNLLSHRSLQFVLWLTLPQSKRTGSSQMNRKKTLHFRWCTLGEILLQSSREHKCLRDISAIRLDAGLRWLILYLHVLLTNTWHNKGRGLMPFIPCDYKIDILRLHSDRIWHCGENRGSFHLSILAPPIRAAR